MEDKGEKVENNKEANFENSLEKERRRCGCVCDCLRLCWYGYEDNEEESDLPEEEGDQEESERSIKNCFGLCPEKNMWNGFGKCSKKNLGNCFGLKKERKKKKRKGMGIIFGVVMPVILNIFGVILFLRLPMGVGNGGILFALLIFCLGYLITGLSVSSICAISTNGTIRGGGAYFMISRVLGPELGGAIGFIFFFANVAGGALYIIGFVDSLTNIAPFFGEYLGGNEFWSKVFVCSVTLILMTIVCLIGADCFGRIGCCIFALLMIALLSMMISFCFLETPLFGDLYEEMSEKGYSGWRWETFTDNLLPYSSTDEEDALFTDLEERISETCTSVLVRTFNRTINATLGEFDEEESYNLEYVGKDDCGVLSSSREEMEEVDASGSYYIDVETNERLNFPILFGILFPACTGAMAGANLSGDLANPSFSIPLGTILATAFTFVIYLFLVVMFGATTTRDALLNNYNITSDVSFLPILVSIGVFSATISSGLTSVIGGSRILASLAKDNLAPFMGWCGLEIGWPTKEPRLAVVFTAVLIQLVLFFPSIGYVAPFVTQFFLVAYCFVNFACFALSVTSTPNFRPTFRYYSWWLSLLGAVATVVIMFFIDWRIALGTWVVCLFIILIIYVYAKPKPWGDILSAILYHLGKKFQSRILLTQDRAHVKYWRLKALALTGHPKEDYSLIQFMDNISRSKGGMCVIGRVRTGYYRERLKELIKDKLLFQNFLRETKFKLFFEITFARNRRQGIQNLLLNAGFAGMDPDVVFLPLFEEKKVENEGGDEGIRGADEISQEKHRMRRGRKLEVLNKFSRDPNSLMIVTKIEPVETSPTESEDAGEENVVIEVGDGSSSINEAVEEIDASAANEPKQGEEENFRKKKKKKEYGSNQFMKTIGDILLVKSGLVIMHGFKEFDRTKCKQTSFFKRLLRKKDFFVDLWIFHHSVKYNRVFGKNVRKTIFDELEEEEDDDDDDSSSENDSRQSQLEEEEQAEEEEEKKKKDFSLLPQNRKSTSLMFQLAYVLLRSSIWKKFHSLRLMVVIDEVSQADSGSIRKEVKEMLHTIRIKCKKIEVITISVPMIRNFLKLGDIIMEEDEGKGDEEDSVNGEEIEKDDDEEEEEEVEDGSSTSSSSGSSISSVEGRGITVSEEKTPDIYDDDEQITSLEEGGETTTTSSEDEREDSEEEDKHDEEFSKVAEAAVGAKFSLFPGGRVKKSRTFTTFGSLRQELDEEGGNMILKDLNKYLKKKGKKKVGTEKDVKEKKKEYREGATGGKEKKKKLEVKFVSGERTKAKKIVIGQEEIVTKKTKNREGKGMGRKESKKGEWEDDFFPDIQIGSKLLNPIQKMTFLNMLIKQNTKKNTSLIMLTLPPPPEKFDSKESHLEYYKVLSAITRDLPPSMLVYSAENVISTKL